MPEHARTTTDEQDQRLERNRAVLMHVIAGDGSAPKAGQDLPMALTLERFVRNRATGATVPYEGRTGVSGLLLKLAAGDYHGGEIVVDGKLVGVAGTLAIDGHDEQVSLQATVGMGAQLILKVGPASSLVTLLDAIRVFDRQVHLACSQLGRDYELVAQGYNPDVSSPSDVVPVPLARNTYLAAALAGGNPYTRDLLRCTAATRLAIPMTGSAQLDVERYRLLAALAPVLAFLTDNTCTVRGRDPQRMPRMSRALIRSKASLDRTGPLPETFQPDFGFVSYERWLEGLRPTSFTSKSGVTFSTGEDTCAQLMADRDLSRQEAQGLLEVAWPLVRWNGSLELSAADALPPRQALAFAALVKGLMGSEEVLRRAEALISLDFIGADNVEECWHALRRQGWDARIYGKTVAQVADGLAAIASSELTSREERRLLDELSQLWDLRSVPRDLLVDRWTASRQSSPKERAVALYGEGAVMSYDDLQGDPPAGSTSVMHFNLG